MKISKKWKKHLEISFYTCVPKIVIRWCTLPEIWCATDRRTDGWKKWHRWVPHLKKSVYFNKYKPFWTLKVVWSTKFYMGILIHLISTLYFTIYLLLQQHTTYYKYFHDDFFHKIKFCSILPEITFTISS